MSKKDIKLMYKGFFETCNRTAKTMGLEGSFAVITNERDMESRIPVSSKDGLTVTKNCFFENPYKNVGAYFAKQASARTLLLVGDATTTTLVFAKALVKNCKYYNSRVNEGIEIAQKEYQQLLKRYSVETSDKHMEAIATTSANNDKELGKIVAEAYRGIDNNGFVTIEESYDSVETTLSFISGMHLKKGWKSPMLINNNENATWTNTDVNVLVYEGNIGLENINEIAKFLDEKKKEPILIFCEHISDDVMLNIENHVRSGKLDLCVVESPYFADERKTILSDIALYSNTTAHIQGSTKGYSWGKVEKATVESESTTLVQKEVSKDVKDLVKSLKKQKQNQFLKDRINGLAGMAAVISVGDIADGARKEKYDRVEDAVLAVKPALEEGIIAGGGSALVYISTQMINYPEDKDMRAGYEVFKKALLAPYKTVLKNARVPYKDFIDYSAKGLNKGYNLKTNKVENLLESGIIDSVKGVKVAMENATSVALLLLNTKVVITR